MKRNIGLSFSARKFAQHVVLMLVGTLIAVGIISSSSPAYAISCPKINSAGKPSIKPDAKINWSGCDLHNINLKGTNLVKANFLKANLSGANLTDANLSQANLSQANLNKANLTHANIYYASFNKASLVSATLDRTYLDSKDDPDASVRMMGFTPSFVGANLSNATLKSANLFYHDPSYGWDHGTDFSEAKLVSTNFASANLSFGRFDRVNLSKTNLTNANLKRVHSVKLSGVPTALPTGWKLVNGYLIGSFADLSNADFSGKKLSHFTFDNVLLGNADFTGATLESMKFSNVNCANGNFARAKLKLVTFKSSDCGYSNFAHANLLNVSSDDNSTFDSSTFVGASIRDDINDSYILSGFFTNCNFTGANLEGVNFGPRANFGSASDENLVTSSGITGNPWSLPSGWKLVNGALQES